MSVALAAPNDEMLLRTLWGRLARMERWPTEYRLFFLAAAARLVENDGVTGAVQSLARPRGLLSLGRSYATAHTSSAQAWMLAKVWLDRLSLSVPGLERLAEPSRALPAAPSLAECRSLYGGRWDLALKELIEDFLISPWPQHYPSPMASVMVLHIEATLLRVLLSVHPAAMDGRPAEAIEEVLRAVRPLGHRPALLQPLIPRIDGVTLSLTLLRM